MMKFLILGLALCIPGLGLASTESKPATPATSTNPPDDKNIGEQNLKAADLFFEENKKKEGVVTLPSGLQYKILTEGTGQSPNISDFVTVKYQGSFPDGKVFDQSPDNQPVTFAVNAVIPAWTEALQLMKTGAKWIIYAPPKLAYGERGAGKVIGPNAALIFDVELLAIKSPPSDNEDPNSIYDEDAAD